MRIMFCSSYRTPLWGFSGHLQTLVYSYWGRFTNISNMQGERRSVVVKDGTTVWYDVFEPNGGPSQPYMMLLIPGELMCDTLHYCMKIQVYVNGNLH